MGTMLIHQKRGKGGPIYRTPRHRFVSNAKYPAPTAERMRAQVIDFVQDPSKDVLLAQVLLGNNQTAYMLAAEGMRLGNTIEIGKETDARVGNVTSLEHVPDSAMVFNVELKPNDGGRLARTSGAFATVVSHDEDTGMVEVKLASKRTMQLLNDCRVTFGIASGGGRIEKPLKKAGNAFYKWHSRNKYWPKVRGTAMSAYDHPHGGKSFGKPTMVKRSTPPGAKVGHIAARRVGRRSGKEREVENK